MPVERIVTVGAIVVGSVGMVLTPRFAERDRRIAGLGPLLFDLR
jgi:hypothetical protein